MSATPFFQQRGRALWDKLVHIGSGNNKHFLEFVKNHRFLAAASCHTIKLFNTFYQKKAIKDGFKKNI
jgi:hypothetical protein